MLTLDRLALRRGPRLLIEDAALTIYAGYRTGVTGANGSGKSSLFSLVLGEIHADAGDLRLPEGLTIAHVAQETPSTDRPAIEYVIDGDNELRRIQYDLECAETDGDGHRQAELHAWLDAIDGYAARSRAAKLMHGLGFTPEQDEVPLRTLSGGWRMRLNLAQALMCRSDLLLLDEPTNHLDLDAVIWLETWLTAYPGTLLLISHDRDFLDRVTDHILHIEQQRATLYTGNYSDFETQRAARLATQHAAWEKQQREVRHMQQFVERFRAKATKARQAQSRLKALERMELIAPAHVDSPFHFSFCAPERLASPLCRMEDVSAGYNTTPVLKGLHLNIAPGQRIGLLGHNGAGKSTLIKLLAREIEPLAGRRTDARDLRIGYFAQHQLDQLDASASPLLHLHRLDPKASEQALLNFLGGFGFPGERAGEPVAPFSGGEKARLVLALLVYQRPGLLLLDEPTNHLDLEMRLSLTVALQDFEGAVVLVSHDRHLLRTVTDELLLVNGGQVRPFDGDLDDYPRWLAEERRRIASRGETPEQRPGNGAVRRGRRREEAERRRQLAPLRRETRRLEAALECLSEANNRIERRLADPKIYEDAAKPELVELLESRARLAMELAQAEAQWLSASEALEEAQGE
ncbi:MAG: ATP-binding cassette domain-containing protein [Gammaproteobacteria bacterium]|nr:ATP-binding cassette domain-containing protein [Gammaproteobacteria bacterium]